MKNVKHSRKVKRQSKRSVMYDLTLDRRIVAGRRDSQYQPLDGIQYFDRRASDRRIDRRPLNDFPFLPIVIL
jgi:hypothetical protein